MRQRNYPIVRATLIDMMPKKHRLAHFHGSSWENLSPKSNLGSFEGVFSEFQIVQGHYHARTDVAYGKLKKEQKCVTS